MKKLLEKPWAKALAFLLTLLPGTAAVYGGVELVYRRSRAGIHICL